MMFQTQRTSTRSSFFSGCAGLIVVLGVVFLAVAAVFAVGSRTASSLRGSPTQMVRDAAAHAPATVDATGSVGLQDAGAPRS